MYSGYGYGLRGAGFFWDPTYILVIIGLVISLLASSKVKSTFNKYNKMRAASGITAAQAAQKILHGAGIYDVSIAHISGNLTDNYNPTTRVLNLSDSTYNSTSVAAIGVAAHECGHAIQHDRGYVPLTLRSSLVPVVNFGGMASWPLIIVGVLLSWNQTLITIGILLFSLTVLFQLITLPVEFNASNRAMKILAADGMLYEDELKGAKKVLSSAALTYVAGAAASILSLLRLILLFGGRRR